MRARVAIVYNEPISSRYNTAGEEIAAESVLKAVEAVHRSLLELDYEVGRVPLVPPLESARQKLSQLKVDLVFNLFEGFTGFPQTEADVPEILDELGISYTGCTARVLRLRIDKVRVKELLQDAGIDTPDFQLLTPQNLDQFRLKFPCIVKPRGEDASHGISAKSVVHDRKSLAEQVKNVSEAYGGEALVEEYIEGREFNITVYGDSEYSLSPVSEIIYSLPPGLPKILTFEAKWKPETVYYQGTQPCIPAEISQDELKKIQDIALKVFKRLAGKGYARVDMRRSAEGRYFVLELNANPDIGPDAGAALQAEAAGLSYTQFVEKIVKLALEHPEVKIHPMVRQDKPSIMHILENTPEFKPGEVKVAEELIDSYLYDPQNSGYFVLTAELNKQVVGYICYGDTPMTEGTWDIYWVAVQRERQGQGVGRALMESAEKDIREHKGRLVLVETSSKPDYEKTRRFYLNLGYKVVSQIADFYEPGDDKVTLEKRFK